MQLRIGYKCSGSNKIRDDYVGNHSFQSVDAVKATTRAPDLVVHYLALWMALCDVIYYAINIDLSTTSQQDCVCTHIAHACSSSDQGLVMPVLSCVSGCWRPWSSDQGILAALCLASVLSDDDSCVDRSEEEGWRGEQGEVGEERWDFLAFRGWEAERSELEGVGCKDLIGRSFHPPPSPILSQHLIFDPHCGTRRENVGFVLKICIFGMKSLLSM